MDSRQTQDVGLGFLAQRSPQGHLSLSACRLPTATLTPAGLPRPYPPAQAQDGGTLGGLAYG